MKKLLSTLLDGLWLCVKGLALLLLVLIVFIFALPFLIIKAVIWICSKLINTEPKANDYKRNRRSH